MTNDSQMIFDTVAKLAGLTVIFDPDFTSRRISVELTNVTLEQALDIVSLEAKAFWKPVTNDIIFVAPDQAQKRRDYEEEVVRTIYLKNTILPQDMTEIINGLRQLLDLRRVQQFNAQNAIIVRDTPDKVMLAEKIIDDIDKPKSEVVIQFAVLQARRDRMRDLGINPGTTGVADVLRRPTQPRRRNSTTTAGTTTTNNDRRPRAESAAKSLGTADYSITLPSATATALLTDSQTQNHRRSANSHRGRPGRQAAHRRPRSGGDRKLPGRRRRGRDGSGGGIVNPLVNTQFQYLDVGVIVDVTPRIHPENREVSMKLSVEVSSVTGTQSIGGINQPVISTSKIEHDVRLQDGEVNILGGLIETDQQRNRITGWPGFSQIPFLKYFTSREQYRERGPGSSDRGHPAHHSHAEYHGGESAQHRLGHGHESGDSPGIRGDVAARFRLRPRRSGAAAPARQRRGAPRRGTGHAAPWSGARSVDRRQRRATGLRAG